MTHQANIKFFLSAILFILPLLAQGDLDDRLELIINVYELSSKSCEQPVVDDATRAAGEALFESKELSGNYDISCRNCHLDQFGTADGLPLAVGVGGDGEGQERMLQGEGILVQRNTLSLVGRAHSQFRAYFWDGKAELNSDNQFVTQFGEFISDKYQSLLAVAASLPLIERDEFIGKQHTIMSNEVERAVQEKLYHSRYQAVSEILRERINQTSPSDLGKKIAVAGIDLKRLELADIGNLIAAFIATEFPCSTSRWDKYLNGERHALSPSEKRGAVLFYGKARCATCHGGPLFSDFKFHSIGVPQGEFGPHTRHRDIGRASVTNDVRDLYRFRTPPLIEVRRTAPYGHNGMFKSLEDVVVHHFNPIEIFIKTVKLRDTEYFSAGRILDSRNPSLSAIELNADSELEDLASFLKTL